MPVGCYATAGAYTEADYVEADVAPVHVEVYPHYEYDRRTVYLVDGRWYYVTIARARSRIATAIEEPWSYDCSYSSEG